MTRRQRMRRLTHIRVGDDGWGSRLYHGLAEPRRQLVAKKVINAEEQYRLEWVAAPPR